MLSFLTGVLIKVYDDFVDDIPVLTNEYAVTSLRTLTTAVTALALAQDFWIYLGFVLFNGLCALSSWTEYSRPHVVSSLVMAPVILPLVWSHRPSVGPIDLAVLTGLVGVAVFEPKAFPEETSVLKGLSRFAGAWSLFSAAWLFRKISPSTRSLLWMFGGYSLASSMAQMLRLFPSGLSHASLPVLV